MTDVNIDELYANRRKRFNDILDGYELGAGDWSVIEQPTREEAMRALPRDRLPLDATDIWPGKWVLLEHGNGGGYFATNLHNHSEIEETAARHAREGMAPECYFDLDVLVGEEPMVGDGDIVIYEDDDEGSSSYGKHRYRVERVDEDLVEGEIAHYPVLVQIGGHFDRPDAGWDDYDHRVYWDEVEVIERAYPDDRMPMRYSVAAVKVVVAFNTVPSP